MSTSVLSQLQTVEAELSSQVKELESQLGTTQEKLSGIQTVIEMYSETGSPVGTSSEPAVEESESASEESTETPTAKPEEAPSFEEESVEAKPKGKSRAKTTTAQKRTAKKKKTTNKKTAKKKDGRAATWQKYTRPGVKDKSIPDAVRIILETQPDKDFKIAEVMDALFQEEMPKNQYLKARNRISNVLSGGVRDGEWFKGQRGAYRMTTA